MNIFAGIQFGIRKGLRYKVNTYSWFLADLALYASVILMYFLISTTFTSFGAYTKTEMGLYISTYFIINNLFAVLFSEAVSEYGASILNGSFSYYQLTPVGPLRSLILLNFNFAAMLSTPALLAMNIYFVVQLFTTPVQVILYYLGVLFCMWYHAVCFSNDFCAFAFRRAVVGHCLCHDPALFHSRETGYGVSSGLSKSVHIRHPCLSVQRGSQQSDAGDGRCFRNRRFVFESPLLLRPVPNFRGRRLPEISACRF